MQFVYGIIGLIIAFLVYIYVKLILKIKDQNLRIEELKLSNKTLSIEDETLRCFRHDFLNFVQALDGYTQNNDIVGIRKMNKEILRECEELHNIETLNSKTIGDAGIYNILAQKYCIAKNENITMNIEVLMNISEAKISNYQLCKILSILLDNAIEAAKECDEKVINVKFVNDLNNNKRLIIIENSYNRIDIDINKIFEKGYSTKKNNKDHGLGLWNVRKILNTTENLNLFTTKDKLFSQQLEIYN